MDGRSHDGNTELTHKENPMGATYGDVTIRNPGDPQRSWTGKFLVDTGALGSLVPKTHLEAIGLELRGRRQYVLADGKSIAEIEFEGEIVGGTFICGDDGAEPLLGVTALESAGFEVDPRSEKLKRLPAVLLKAGTLGRQRVEMWLTGRSVS